MEKHHVLKWAKPKIYISKNKIYLIIEFGFKFPSTMISRGDIDCILTTTKYNLGSTNPISCLSLLKRTRKTIQETQRD